jgi:hypothetical protein
MVRVQTAPVKEGPLAPNNEAALHFIDLWFDPFSNPIKLYILLNEVIVIFERKSYNTWVRNAEAPLFRASCKEQGF